MTQTLVVPLDGSEFAERALPVAIALAHRLDGSVVMAMTTAWGGRADRAEPYLSQVSAQYAGVFKTTVVPFENASLAIEYTALQSTDATVCMASHGRGGLRWAMLGSVAEHVVRLMKRPVLLVGRHCEPPDKETDELLVCWDGMPETHAVIGDACTWAKALDLSVHLVFAAHPRVEMQVDLDSMFDDAAGKIETEGLRVKTTLLTGAYFAGAIADFAQSRPTAMLAMATHNRAGLARFGLGSVTMGVVGAAHCPVLVRPTDE
jgi:nucleotide-binding universal stress UspA family protein